MKNQKKAKFFIVLFTSLVLCLFVTAIVQTFVLKDLQAKNKELALKQQLLDKKIEQADREKEYYESEEYIEEFFRKHGNEEDGDITFTK